ncbi:class I SAM-dependent methyltransferase [Blastococcus mobilis]|uniref:Methyltransferase domain-containing protein n=1 Tax=Blastococcus mobilis TaxID=1938746 RepID=A0A238ZQI6_9ACTN|nr:class I SAM-dependent methyltransferase [Blastococcus mobilis]SNR85716.1 Methyltransferase domain-containing protein [Blastococcus mobilis]
MNSIRRVWPSEDGLIFEVDGPGDRVIDVLVDGRRVWSFRESAEPAPPGPLPAGAGAGCVRFQPWPVLLRPRLAGRFQVRLVAAGDDRGTEATADLGAAPGSPELTDRFGRPLVVNKWGRLGRAIVDAGPGMVERMLDHMDDVRTLLEKHLGPAVFVTGGTLLGPVREGRVLPHDDDADLAYLSRRSHPVDVALEAFEIGRLLGAAGYEVVRLSAGHLQIHFTHEGAPDHYVDVFTGFVLDGRWHQHFAIRRAAEREDLLPPSTVLVEGREEPAPRQPELMLEATFGPDWRTPDPSFAFRLPASTSDRFYGWFADYNVEREDWDDELLLALHDPADEPVQISAFGRWVHERAPQGSALLELGCGIGSDALALAEAGHAVRAVDFSRYAVRAAQARLAGRELDVSFDVLNLLDTRQVIRLGAELASSRQSWTVLGRRLLNALEDRGRHNVFRLSSMLLRAGESAYFDVVADHDYPGIHSYRHVSVPQVVAEAADHRLVLEEAVPRLEPLRWFGQGEEQIVEMHRMTFRRRTR